MLTFVLSSNVMPSFALAVTTVSRDSISELRELGVDCLFRCISAIPFCSDTLPMPPQVLVGLVNSNIITITS